MWPFLNWEKAPDTHLFFPLQNGRAEGPSSGKFFVQSRDPLAEEASAHHFLWEGREPLESPEILRPHTVVKSDSGSSPCSNYTLGANPLPHPGESRGEGTNIKDKEKQAFMQLWRQRALSRQFHGYPSSAWTKSSEHNSIYLRAGISQLKQNSNAQRRGK